MNWLAEAPLSLALAYGALALTPGANSLLLLQVSLSSPRRSALCAAMGVAVGAGLLAFLAIGAQAPLAGCGTVLWALEALWAGLVLRLGLRALLRAGLPGGAAPRPFASGPASAFRLGLLTAATNPVTFVFFLGRADAGGALTGGAAAALVALAWSGTLAFCFGDPRMRLAYGRLRPVLDVATGLFFLALGGRALLRLVAA